MSGRELSTTVVRSRPMMILRMSLAACWSISHSEVRRAAAVFRQLRALRFQRRLHTHDPNAPLARFDAAQHWASMGIFHPSVASVDRCRRLQTTRESQ
jgi:hypothetical protein